MALLSISLIFLRKHRIVLNLPAELAVFPGKESDVTALAPVDAFKVEVAARLNRPEKHPWLSRMQQTLAELQISMYARLGKVSFKFNVFKA